MKFKVVFKQLNHKIILTTNKKNANNHGPTGY